MRLRYEIPTGFDEEIRWLKFFKKRSLIVLLVVLSVGFLLGKFLAAPFGLTLYFFIFWLMVTIVVTGSTMLKMPSDNWLLGGGEYLDQILVKRLIRKKKRCLYIKGYSQTAMELEEKAYVRVIEAEEEERRREKKRKEEKRLHDLSVR